MQRIGAIDVDQALEGQGRGWRAQRVGWVLMLLIVLAGLLGLAGRGPLATATAGGGDAALRIEYQRFARHGSPLRLVLHVAPNVAARDSTVRVWIGRRLLQAAEVSDILPTPAATAAGPDGDIYAFRVADPARDATIAFDVQPQAYWSHHASVRLVGRPAVAFTVFVFP
ncbi:MAG TPA: hypothetical protein VFK13_05195 [Gemmatimonadaceae bacterium]|nr:hypothetical protein [Gemmatimonadaceae bacterium]